MAVKYNLDQFAKSVKNLLGEEYVAIARVGNENDIAFLCQKIAKRVLIGKIAHDDENLRVIRYAAYNLWNLGDCSAGLQRNVDQNATQEGAEPQK